jgi:hypothetical protein
MTWRPGVLAVARARVPGYVVGVAKRGVLPFGISLVIVPLVAVSLSTVEPTDYRAVAALLLTGSNTGTLTGDLDQARYALRVQHGITARTIDVTDVRGVKPRELRSAANLALRGPGFVELSINRPTSAHLSDFCKELSRQLARDQRAVVISDDCKSSKVAPRPLQSGLLALGLAFPLGVGLAALFDAITRRRQTTSP